MKKGKSFTDEKIIEEVEKILHNRTLFEQWLSLIYKESPEFHKWIVEKAKSWKPFSFPFPIQPQENNSLGTREDIIAFFVIGYAFYNLKLNEEISLLLLPNHEFERWLRGEFPDSYYRYSIKGLEKDDYRYKAKIAHQKRVKEGKRITEAFKFFYDFVFERMVDEFEESKASWEAYLDSLEDDIIDERYRRKGL
ncbi:MAG: hypothetical protein J7L42_05170 [Elusimicrobia bacterium]|nr:hypothetical protein [Elusimicrobiota bacterium]